MATLKQFVAKKPARKAKTPVPVLFAPVEVEVKQGQRSRPRELYHLYAALQKRHGIWVVPYEGDQRLRTCFRKLSLRFEEAEEKGQPLDAPLYIRAHKEVYGIELRPYHLIGKYSMAIYQDALETQYAEVIMLTDEEVQAYDHSVIADLATLHGESEDMVTALLLNCGLL